MLWPSTWLWDMIPPWVYLINYWIGFIEITMILCDNNLFSDEMDCFSFDSFLPRHYGDVIMGWMASQITNLTIVYLTVYSGAHQRKYQSSVSHAFVWAIHQGPVNSLHKWPVTWKMFPFDDVIMQRLSYPGLTRSISWLLMPWLFASPCHQQPSLTM